MSAPLNPLVVFISYAHKDEPFKDRLVSYLTPLRRRGAVKVWEDRQIDGGDDWREKIDKAMDDCNLALLLVSDAFLASDFIQSVELKRLLERRATEEVRVTPIILRPCPWEFDVISELQALPRDGKAIITFPEDTGARDQVWTDIARKIAEWGGLTTAPRMEPDQPRPEGWAMAAPPPEPASAAAATLLPGDGATAANPQLDLPAPDDASLLSGLLAKGRGLADFARTALGDFFGPTATLPDATPTVSPPPAYEPPDNAPCAAPPVTARVNPFNPWDPAVPPRFFGREEELQRLSRALDEKRSVSLVGDWRIGKTSLLHTWKHQAEARGRIVKLLSGEGPEAVCCAAFVRAATSQDVPANDADPDTVADALSAWADAIAPAGLPPLLLVDEADRILPLWPERFFERLLDMQGSICLVLASHREVDHIYRDANRTSPFINRLELMRLELLDEASANALIATGNGVLAPDDGPLMLRWAGRHPCFLALLGRYLWEARSRDGDIGEALELFKDEADLRLRDLWRNLKDSRREQLRKLLSGEAPDGDANLARRGLADGNHVFGEVLAIWLQQQETRKYGSAGTLGGTADE